MKLGKISINQFFSKRNPPIRLLERRPAASAGDAKRGRGTPPTDARRLWTNRMTNRQPSPHCSTAALETAAEAAATTIVKADITSETSIPANFENYLRAAKFSRRQELVYRMALAGMSARCRNLRAQELARELAARR
jgi:hypothetical protein